MNFVNEEEYQNFEEKEEYKKLSFQEEREIYKKSRIVLERLMDSSLIETHKQSIDKTISTLKMK